MNLGRVRNEMEKQDIDLLIVTEPSNFIYTIGEEASGYMFITQDDLEIIAPRFYLYQLEDYKVEYVFSREEYRNEIEKKAEKYSGNIAADTDSEKLKKRFDAEKTDLLGEMRKIKTSKEIEKIQKSCRITDKALENLRPDLFNGLTEFEAASRLNTFYAEKGVTEAFLTNKGQSLVQRNSLRPHRPPEMKKIRPEDMVIVDTGARKDFYCSDVTRTYCENPSEKQIDLFETVKKIQEECIEIIEPGKPIKEVKKRELELVEELGYNPDKHVLYVSHGIGIETHEPPKLTRETEGEFKEGMVVTVEPGLHVPSLGGCRIEDTVAVTSKGGKRLSKTARRL